MKNMCLSAAVMVVAASGAMADLTFAPAAGLPVGPGMGFANFSNPAPPTFSNNDVAGQEQLVTVQVQKRFDAVATIDSPMLINVWSVNGATVGAAVEYSVFELVTNNTGQTWTGFEMELGENVLAAFQPYSSAGVMVTFDVPNQTPAPLCSAFSSVAHTAHKMTFGGGSLLPGQTMSIRFQLDNLTPQDFNADGVVDLADIYGITLREVPMIPAPGTLVMAGIGGLTLMRRRR